jgi:Xaa-Pro aminopeptidase
MVVTLKKSYILTDSRYTEHAAGETNGFEIVEYDSSLASAFGELSKKLGFSRVGFESHGLSIFNFKKLKKFCKHLKLIPVAHLIEDLRSIKDYSEASKLKKAINIADSAFTYVLNNAKVGMTEKELAWEMEKFMKENGAQNIAWSPFIVASGANSSMAHWGATDRRLKKNDMVLVDYGCVWEGYHSDITRVFFMGKPTSEQRKVYNLVLGAQRLGKSLVKSGKVGATIDKKVREFLEKGNKHFYRHSLGHGIGLEVHELPRLSINSKNKLVAGNVVTVEPGIYIPGWGGVRIEDIVIVTKEGCNTLTKAPKNINEVTI